MAEAEKNLSVFCRFKKFETVHVNHWFIIATSVPHQP